MKFAHATRILFALSTIILPYSYQSLLAQAPEPRPIVAASGRVSASVSFDGRLMGGGTSWLNRSTSHSGPARMTLDYGQPHARGRQIFGGLVPYGEVWRLGANMATHFTVDLNIRLGDLEIPRGMYTLYLIPREDGAQLIVNRQVRQWGTDFDPSLDLGRLELRRRELPETVQSLTLTLEPSLAQGDGALPSGTLRISWGRIEYSTEWSVTWKTGL